MSVAPFENTGGFYIAWRNTVNQFKASIIHCVVHKVYSVWKKKRAHI